MQTILVVVHLFFSLGTIGLVLIQHGKGADAGAAFGSGASATVFGARGSTSFLSRATAVLATLFFVTSMALAYYASQTSQPRSGIMDQVPATTDDATPAVQDIASEINIPVSNTPSVVQPNAANSEQNQLSPVPLAESVAVEKPKQEATPESIPKPSITEPAAKPVEQPATAVEVKEPLAAPAAVIEKPVMVVPEPAPVVVPEPPAVEVKEPLAAPTAVIEKPVVVVPEPAPVVAPKPPVVEVKEPLAAPAAVIEKPVVVVPESAPVIAPKPPVVPVVEQPVAEPAPAVEVKDEVKEPPATPSAVIGKPVVPVVEPKPIITNPEPK